MALPSEPELSASAAPVALPAAGQGARGLALVAGLGALGLLTVGTLGFVLLALLGMGVAWAVAHRRGRPLTRGAGWWGASLAVALGCAAIMAFGMASMSPGTIAQMQQSSDSAVAASPPPELPEWLQRLDPTAGAKAAQRPDSTMERFFRSPAFLIWTGAMSTLLASAVLGALVGTLGWGAGLLLVFGATGRWLPRKLEPPPTARR